jgi:2-methylisocitrate lyase-like PEP mutase family enzyme
MTMLTTRFRKLHDNTSPLLLANAWDAGSARLIESLGAPAVATTSAGVAWALGYRDGRRLPIVEVFDMARRMTRVLEVPLSMDIENGYADAPLKVAEHVVRLAELGVAGINIEDGTDPPALLAAKIEASRNALAKARLDLFINARSDVFLAGLADPPRLVEESLARAAIYASAGADGLFLPAIVAQHDIETVARACRLPLNVMARPGLADAQALARAGVRRVSAGAAIAQAMWDRAGTLAAGFHAHGDADTLMKHPMLPYAQLQALFAAA